MFSLICGYYILYEDKKSLYVYGRNIDVKYSGGLWVSGWKKGGVARSGNVLSIL